MSPTRRKSDKSILSKICNKPTNVSLLDILIFRVKWLMFNSETYALRFWFGLTSIGFGLFMLTTPMNQLEVQEYRIMLSMASIHIWGLAFFIHGIVSWYGVITLISNKFLLIFEGVLGLVVWTAASISIMIAQSAPGAVTAGIFIAFWLLVRYPTNWERVHGL